MYNAACLEMANLLPERQAEADELESLCKEQTFQLIDLHYKLSRGGGISSMEIAQMRRELEATDSAVESAGIFDLVISPTTAIFCQALDDQNLVYVRLSSLYPNEVELLVPSLDVSTTALTVVAKPIRPERRLSKLLTATLEKIQSSAESVTNGDQSKSIDGVIAGSGDSIHVSFQLPPLTDDDVDDAYLVKVNLYGRPVRNSPMEIRICPRGAAIRRWNLFTVDSKILMLT